MTFADIINSALTELNAIDPGGSPTTVDQTWVLDKLNRLFDRWAARGILAFNVTFSEFNLTANHSPTTIGPTGDFTVAQRPVLVESAQFQLSPGSGSNPAVWTWINVQDDQWWASNTIPDLTNSIITNLYYSPDWPNGKLYFWPICTGTNKVRLELWGLLPQNSSTSTTFSLPPGYWDAVIWNLAASLIPSFTNISPDVAADVRAQAKMSLKDIEANNIASPRIQTIDFGMPRKSARPDYNFLNGSPWNTQ